MTIASSSVANGPEQANYEYTTPHATRYKPSVIGHNNALGCSYRPCELLDGVITCAQCAHTLGWALLLGK